MADSEKQEIETVEEVVKQWLCTSCGACAGACPQNSIEMKINSHGIYVPEIDEDSCNKCGLCVEVCPGHEFDYIKHQKRIFGKLPDHVGLGHHQDVYAGHTNLEDILQQCQSGGFVSTVLIHCLEKGIIDGAVVTKWKEDSPFEPETYIANNREEVLNAVGSKYNPVPASQILNKLLDKNGKYAFVGTSCQIQAMRKAETSFPELAEKIKLYIGLHCLGVFTYHFHDQMCHKIGKPKDEITYFRHRSKEWRGWPCDMRLETKDDDIFDIDANTSRLNPRPFFTSWRCKLCFDKTNEFSDVSCGDCRMSELHEEIKNDGYELKKGLSEFVVRTERGKKIVEDVISDGLFEVWTAEPDMVVSSIGMEKKLGIEYFSRVAKHLGRKVPKYGVEFYPSDYHKDWKWNLYDIWTLFRSFSDYYLPYALNKSLIFRGILKRIPHNFFGRLRKLGNYQINWSRFKRNSSLKLRVVDEENKKNNLN